MRAGLWAEAARRKLAQTFSVGDASTADDAGAIATDARAKDARERAYSTPLEDFHVADRFIIDRERPRQHVAFGFGVHRCLGNRLAEMQLRVVWEEILKRFERIEVVGEPTRLKSNFVKGYEALPVRIVG